MNEQINYWFTAIGKNDAFAFLRDDAREAVAKILAADSTAAAFFY
jgi:hypothetical protein